MTPKDPKAAQKARQRQLLTAVSLLTVALGAVSADNAYGTPKKEGSRTAPMSQAHKGHHRHHRHHRRHPAATSQFKLKSGPSKY